MPRLVRIDPLSSRPPRVRRSGAAIAAAILVAAGGCQQGSDPDGGALDIRAAFGLYNEGFEFGLDGWYSQGSTAISYLEHGGSKAGQAGSKTSEANSYLAQTFVVPAEGGVLSFWYQGFCNNTLKYAWATATLYDHATGNSVTLLPKVCAKTGTWKKVSSASLKPKGVYTLRLINQGNVYGSQYNFTLFDDVALTAEVQERDDFSVDVEPGSVVLPAGGQATLTIETAVTSGKAQSIALSASGLPAGVTASFAPSTVTAGQSATLLLTASTAATAAITTISVIGGAASGTHAATANVEVTALPSHGDFTLSLTPAVATLVPGGSATVALGTGLIEGQPGDISLSLVGLPAGVTGTISPARVAVGQGATITLSAAAGASESSTVYGVRGAGSSMEHTIAGTVRVSEAASDFALSVAPASLTVAAGGSGRLTVSTSVTAGQPTDVTLSVSGLPAGVTAAFEPGTVRSGTTTTLTVSAASSAAAANATLMIAGSAGALRRTASAGLTVARGGVGNGGGAVDHLFFAVIGDTRPGKVDSTSTYPTEIITRIFQTIEGLDPRPQFVVGTGDYMFANVNNAEAQPQMDLFMAARRNYSGPLFPAIGNHECTGYTASNCTSLDQTRNIQVFMKDMIAPLGQTEPYFGIPIRGLDGSWNAKVLVVACNYWNAAQQTWLADQLANNKTTYTIMARHEPASATNAPCVNAVEALMQQHPYDLSLVGHAHNFYVNGKQITVGNSGAPISNSSTPYGFGTVERTASGWQIKQYDYSTGLPVNTYDLP